MPCAWGGPSGTARLRAQPEDFRVDEMLGFEPEGEGEHAWLWVAKRGANTIDVAGAIAEAAGTRARAVGYAGLKDRHALTRQWFSVHVAETSAPHWHALGDETWWVEHATRHRRKLRTGSHRANRFALCLRGLSGAPGGLTDRLERVAAGGFPNYFGPQRFGRGGENLQRARRALNAGRRAGGIQLSAARSWLFNRVLAERVAAGTWNQALEGEAVMLDGTHSVFQHTGEDPSVPERVARFDVHPTGPLWGTGRQPLGASMAAREAEWLADEAALRAGLERAGVRAARRALRARAADLAWVFDGDELRLSFTLPRGCFATSLVRELLDTRAPAWTGAQGLE